MLITIGSSLVVLPPLIINLNKNREDFSMPKRDWQKPIISAISAGLLVLNTSAVLAATAPMLSLDDSVALALKNNPSVKMAAADNSKASWGISEAKAGGLPSLSLTNSDTRGFSDASAIPGNSFSTSLRVNWPLYTGGRVEGQVEQAQANAHAAQLGVDKAKQQVKLNATTAYYNVLQARSMVQVNQEAVDNLDAHLKNVQAQFNAGTVAKSDVLRSDVELANAQQNLTKAKNAYDVAVAALNNTIGVSMDSQNSYKDELGYVKYDMSLDDSIAMAMKNRPELGQSQDSLKAAQAGIKVADSGRLPTISVSGAEGWTGSDFPGNNNNWSVGVSASWNLFDAGLTTARSKEAQASFDKATQADAQTRDGVELEVRQDYLSMKEAEQRIETTKVAVDKSAEDLKIAEAKYNAGAGTNLDVIDAQLAQTQAKTNYTQALYDYNVNKAKLENAVGTAVN
jgi:TolC family type I secretion outer membrane protein